MQYQVPQFIEIEDKIFGPLTFKQFAYVAGGGAMCFLAWRFLPVFISIFIIVPVGGFALALAFYKVNNRPFVFMVESAIKYFFNKKLYIWQKEKKKQVEKTAAVAANKVYIPKLSESKLKELTWSLDINDTIYSKSQKSPIINGDSKEVSSFKGLSEDMKKQWQ